MKFPREVWAGSHIKNAPQMKRKIVQTKSEYIDFVKTQNNKTNVYTTVYDFEHFSDSAKIEHSVVVNRIFLDFDAHGDDALERAFQDVCIIMEHVKQNDWEHSLFFSGRGFHLFIEGERTNSIRNIQVFFRQLKSLLGEDSTLDDRVGQISRLRRVPNTVNLSSSDENGNPYYCVPLFYDDLHLGLEGILTTSKTYRQLPFRKEGSVKVVFPEAPPLEEIEGEVEVPAYDGTLPILPCLYNATMSENPAHISRAYLVAWYRDLLSGYRDLKTQEDKRRVLDLVIEELKVSFGEKEDVWLDWDEATTRQHAKFTVYGNYNTPSCAKLISDGYCVGKCWRYPKE